MARPEQMKQRDRAWNHLSPDEKKAEGIRIKTILLAKCGEPITSVDAMHIINMVRQTAGRYLRQLERENRVRRISKFKLTDKKSHWLDGYIATGSLDYLNQNGCNLDGVEGVTDSLLHMMGYGKTEFSGSKRDLTEYHKAIETEGNSWNPNVQKCLGGFSYGVGSSLL